MEKIVGDFSTLVRISGEEAKSVCKLGQGALCCAFLVVSAKGFECIRMDYPNNVTICNRLEQDRMSAKGRGGWIGCAWEGQPY